MHDNSDQDRGTPDDALDRQVRAFLDCRPLIKGHIAALVRDRALADDVFQEVWVRFERVTRSGEVIANVAAWCRTGRKNCGTRNQRLWAAALMNSRRAHVISSSAVIARAALILGQAGKGRVALLAPLGEDVAGA
jgi:hypothetical protein